MDTAEFQSGASDHKSRTEKTCLAMPSEMYLGARSYGASKVITKILKSALKIMGNQ